jgi:hypothetical protein
MPFIALKDLKGVRFWADESKRTGFDADPENSIEHDVILSLQSVRNTVNRRKRRKMKMHQNQIVSRS